MVERVFHLTFSVLGVASIPPRTSRRSGDADGDRSRPTPLAGIDLSGVKHVPDRVVGDREIHDTTSPHELHPTD
jgi:hypothetical protein